MTYRTGLDGKGAPAARIAAAWCQSRPRAEAAG